MESKTLIIYQSGKKGHTKVVAEQIAAELNCKAVNILEEKPTNLEQYQLIGIGSGVYFCGFGGALKKYIKDIKWSSPEVSKPDAFLFSTHHLCSGGAQHRFTKLLDKKAGIITITGWACSGSKVNQPEAMANLKEWVNNKLKAK